jgi:hypothetical protein
MWDFGPTGQDFTLERQAFANNYLHSTFKADPSDIGFIGGIAGDPISGGFLSGISYTPHRSGAAGDEVSLLNGLGTAAYTWIDDATPDNVGVRWTSSAPLGNSSTAAWGGQNTQVASMFWEVAELNVATADDVTRADVVDKTIQWLTGRNHPSVSVSAPAGGGTITGSSTQIAWTASAAGGFSIGTTTLEYSADLGQTWVTIASGALSSPYDWDLSGVNNNGHMRVRVRVVDSGSPSLTGYATTGSFAIARPGGDIAGPVIVAGSTVFAANPVDRDDTIDVTAAASDSSSGGSMINAAEYSIGSSPAAAGAGTPMSGAFGVSQNATLSASTAADPLSCTTDCIFWVRAQDAAGNWGPASGTSFVVRPDPTDARNAGGDPASRAPNFALGAARPNPFGSFTEISFSLAHAGPAELRIYDANGSLVTTIVREVMDAGAHVARWTGSTDRGHRAAAGVYFARLTAGGRTLTRRIVMLD